MVSVATPDKVQSEAYAATATLFLIFASQPKEEKVYLRLPPIWRDLWMEFVTLKKDQSDSEDRSAIKLLRDAVRDKRDREEEDGVVLMQAFMKRSANNSANDTGEESGPENAGPTSADNDSIRTQWTQKCSTPSYVKMMVWLSH
jgi:ATP-dependent RNA helicase DHX29